MRYDVAIVGAGPAGCSCALWLAEFGLSALLVDRAPAPCATLDALRFPQRWVLGQPGATLAEVGAGYRRDIAARSDIAQRYGSAVTAASGHAHAGWQLTLADGSRPAARTLVLATGLQPVHPPQYYNPETASPALHDAVTLTAARAGLAGQRVLLLGGGDNAAENALALAALGCRVTLVSRSALRAQPRYTAAVAAHPAIALHAPAVLPVLQRQPGGGYLAHGPAGAGSYAAVAVLFGYRANLALLEALRTPPDGALPDGVFLAGDVSGRLHPCVPAAVGDGAHTSRQVERWLAAHPA